MARSTWQDLIKGVVRENPIFVLVLGMCPTLAVTTSVENGLAMGLAAGCVLIASNVLISSIRRIVPRQIRIPCYVIIIASFVTMAEILMQRYLPASINRQLGIFIPLIVVNCIILGRAEGFASRNSVWRSFVDGVGMAAGFTLALLLVSTIREVLGSGTWAGYVVWRGFTPISVMVMAPGAFLVLGLCMAFFNGLGTRVDRRRRARSKREPR